jgi:hypothetical protein
MRAVVVTGPGRVELNWTWLPYFISQDTRWKQTIDDKIQPLIVGKPLTNELLDLVHEKVLDLICERHPVIEGLRDYIDSLKYIRDR